MCVDPNKTSTRRTYDILKAKATATAPPHSEQKVNFFRKRSFGDLCLSISGASSRWQMSNARNTACTNTTTNITGSKRGLWWVSLESRKIPVTPAATINWLIRSPLDSFTGCIHSHLPGGICAVSAVDLGPTCGWATVRAERSLALAANSWWHS